ncbi:MAG: SIS domain-containing protein [Victivallaceae bacterium]|nr:SIS domain-containing protein [Victivallaceae bacterium]
MERFPVLSVCVPDIERLIDEMTALFQRGGTFFCCGNGGSAADCDHICGELLKGFMSLRPIPEADRKRFIDLYGNEEALKLTGSLQRGLRAVSLLSHPGFSSAFANDVDADLVYAQQIYAQARPGDLLLGISTGGGSKNVRYAFMAAKAIGVNSCLLTGGKHGICEKFCDFSIKAPETETYRIQELHLPIYHAVCQSVEENMFGGING